MKKSNQQSNRPLHDIPDIDIIDLENDGANKTAKDIEDLDIDDTYYTEGTDDDTFEDDAAAAGKGFRRLLNIHSLFFIVIIGIILIIFIRFQTWGEKVDLDEIFKDGQGTYDNSLDSILPLMDEYGQIVKQDIDTPVIVAFGNGPFADDRDSEDNLCNLIAQKTGGIVYNCSVSDSYLASQGYSYDSELYPMDAYCFYWLATLATKAPIDDYYRQAEEILGDALPDGAAEAYDTLKDLDLNDVDVITIMYDATDYLLGHPMYSDQNTSDIQQFTGNLEAGIELIQDNYPHIRFIVMSPTYAYAVDENGNYVSSDMYTYGHDVLSTYSIMQSASCQRHSVSFIDHLYGTITEDNADEYLIDNLHLNVAGRKLVADRFEYFLNYYSKGYANQ